jgi:apolipoprotein N-acyltransferase
MTEQTIIRDTEVRLSADDRARISPSPAHPVTRGGPGPDRRRYLLLAAATVLSLVAMGGRWDIPLAGWCFPILLLAFARTGRSLSTMVWVWLSGAVATLFWLAESGLPVFGLQAFGGLALNTVLAVPYLLDRWAAPGLSVRHPLLGTLVFPASRVAAEFLIAAVSPFGAVFGTLAATQYTDLPLVQVASVTGAYGISFLVAWLAPVACLLWRHRSAWRRARTAVVTFAAVLATVVVGGSARLAFAVPTSTTVRIAGVSPSQAATDAQQRLLSQLAPAAERGRTDPARLRPALAVVDDELLDLTDREAAAGARIVVWPEEAARTRADDEPALLSRVGAEARRRGVYIDMGLEVYLAQAPYLRDESVLVDPSGQVRWTYDKSHPVPGMDDFPAGPGQVPVVTGSVGRLAGVICYDADFPTLMRQQAGRADIMLVPANDWPQFGATHTRDASIRAVENGYSLVRQDSDGVASAFDYEGHVLASTDYYRTGQQTLVAAVPTSGVRTVYSVVGDLFAWLCVLATAGLLIAAVRGHRSRSRHGAA